MNRIQQEANKSTNPQAAQELLELFEAFSESSYCAGWHAGLEYSLWDALSNYDENNPPLFGFTTLKKYQAVEFTRLSKLAYGWWIWDKNNGGETFVSFERLEEIIKNY
ncbi:MAG: hypothetical protein AAGF26_17445 [Cyanobacteria bacterium P01_G01_bin.49]